MAVLDKSGGSAWHQLCTSRISVSVTASTAPTIGDSILCWKQPSNICTCPDDLCLEINIHSDAPSGASTGTSAAVTVALVGGLDVLTHGRLTPHEVAVAAQNIETELLKQQSGIQDQLASAYGRINILRFSTIRMLRSRPFQHAAGHGWELERRLALIYLGK